MHSQGWAFTGSWSAGAAARGIVGVRSPSTAIVRYRVATTFMSPSTDVIAAPYLDEHVIGVRSIIPAAISAGVTANLSVCTQPMFLRTRDFRYGPRGDLSLKLAN